MKQKNEKAPMVSVIIPTYNRPDLLVKAIESVFNQTYNDYEIIVINDGGENVESSINFSKDRRLTYIKVSPNVERSAARNLGLKLAKGKYISYLDDDDIFYPNHFEILVNFLENSDYNVAYTDSLTIHQQLVDGNYTTMKKYVAHSFDFDADLLHIHNLLPILCVMHKRECLEQTGLFDENMAFHEDWDLLIKLAKNNDFKHIKTVTSEYIFREKYDPGVNNLMLETTNLIYHRHLEDISDKPELIQKQRWYMGVSYPEEQIKNLFNELFHKGIACLQNEDYKEAEKYFLRLKNYDSTDKFYASYYNLSVLKQGRFSERLPTGIKSDISLNALADLVGETEAKLFDASILLYNSGDYSGAEQNLLILNRINQFEYNYLYYLGLSQMLQKKYDSATDAFSECMEIGVVNQELLINIAKCLEALGEHETASLYLEKAEELKNS